MAYDEATDGPVERRYTLEERNFLTLWSPQTPALGLFPM